MIHPQFDPVAIAIGPIKIHWYGLMYLLAFILFYLLASYRINKTDTAKGWSVKELDDLLFYGVLGVVLGGRFGFVVFYKLSDYLADPLAIIKVWDGGMSFHGGLIGVLCAILYFARKTHRPFLAVSDFVAPLVPAGLFFGRLGNFINGELWGRVTSPDAWWAMVFPQAGDYLPRHPSPLYEMALEGGVLFIILWLFSSKPRALGQTSGLFLMGYGVFRFLVEFTREPDSYLGLLTLNLSMGQWLSMPMIFIGAILFFHRRARV